MNKNFVPSIVISNIFLIVGLIFEIYIQGSDQYNVILRFQGSDFFSSGGIMALFYPFTNEKKYNLYLHSFLTLLLLIIYEILQIYIPSKTYDIMDIYAYILGTIFYIGVTISKLHEKPCNLIYATLTRTGHTAMPSIPSIKISGNAFLIIL